MDIKSVNMYVSIRVNVCLYFTGTDKVPIGIIGSKFLESTGLDKVNPLGDLELTSTLEVGSISLDKGYCYMILVCAMIIFFEKSEKR